MVSGQSDGNDLASIPRIGTLGAPLTKGASIPESYKLQHKKLQRNFSGAFYMVPRDRIELPTQGFSDQFFKNSKVQQLQEVDSIPIFHLIFGSIWNCLEIFGLDGHNLGTYVPLNI